MAAKTWPFWVSCVSLSNCYFRAKRCQDKLRWSLKFVNNIVQDGRFCRDVPLYCASFPLWKRWSTEHCAEFSGERWTLHWCVGVVGTHGFAKEMWFLCTRMCQNYTKLSLFHAGKFSKCASSMRRWVEKVVVFKPWLSLFKPRFLGGEIKFDEQFFQSGWRNRKLCFFDQGTFSEFMLT